MSTSAAQWVSAANKRLKGVAISLEVSGIGNNLYLRGTFPAKPWEQDQRSRQRKISLGVRAIAEIDVKNAEQLARQVAIDLNRGEFEWVGFAGIEDPREPDPETIGDWLKVFEAERKSTVTPDTWHYNYECPMKSLPMDQPISEGALIDWILAENSTANTSRAKYVTIAIGLCEAAGIDAGRVKRLRKDAPKENVNPRDLPSDAAIAAMQARTPEDWAWTYGMLATYGLRPHELFRLDFSLWPDVRVLQDSKTGERIVPAMLPDWIETFGLVGASRLPKRLQWHPGQPNWYIGRRIGQGFTRHKLGAPYDLRHCYARRCLELGLSSDVSAKLMGHSREIHEQKYRAFIKSSVYVDAAKRAIAKHSQQ